MGLKSILPWTAPYSKKHASKYFRRLVAGHDALLEIEWPDGSITYDAGDYSVEDTAYVSAKTGLKFPVAGRNAERRSILGIPAVRIAANVAAPVDTDTAVAMDLDEDGEYETEYDVEGNPVERTYDLQPREGTHGWTYSLTNAIERSPFPVNAMDLKDHEERGKMAVRNSADMLKYLFLGIGITVGLVVFLAILYIGFVKLTGAALLLLVTPGSARQHATNAARSWVGREDEDAESPLVT